MKHLRKRVGATSAALALALGALVVNGPAAHASTGGGCDSSTVGAGGFSVRACISSSSGTLVADGYGYGSTSASCYTYIEILNSSYTAIASSGRQGCTSGHHNGTSIYELYGSYIAAFCLVWNGTAEGCSYSPWVNNP